LDTVYVDIKNLHGLREECRLSAWMGFTGKITIHPDQIPIVNELFTPSSEEVALANELLAEFDAAQRSGRMAFSFRGQMVDVPHLNQARRILERARQIRAVGAK
jgi:citrate lyase beta subunit